ncbi:UTRA domain-containing protein [Paenibacillus piri]|uniref:UTRA domain-containing protein n=1 Tax=Paenibacillus piri TaxID=2547395 RepID=A0A4R5K821_9BACL|nr:UTRA domain-containing protein [Paenibacillus piri]
MKALLAPVIVKQLDVNETMPFFYFERISQDVNQLPIEILQSYFRGDKYCYSISLYRD